MVEWQRRRTKKDKSDRDNFPRQMRSIPADIAFFLDPETQLQLLQDEMNRPQPIRMSRAAKTSAMAHKELAAR